MSAIEINEDFFDSIDDDQHSENLRFLNNIHNNSHNNLADDEEFFVGSPPSSEDRKSCTCKDCGKVFNSVWYLKQHAVKHSTERPFKCKYCHKTYRFRSNLYQHKCPSRDRAYELNGSRKSSSSQKSQHKQRKTAASSSTDDGNSSTASSRKTTPKKASNICFSPTSIVNHQSAVDAAFIGLLPNWDASSDGAGSYTSPAASPQKFLPPSPTSEEIQQFLDRHKDQLHKCPQCKILFPSREYLTRHTAWHDVEESKVKCTFCSELFENDQLYGLHKQSHVPHSMFICAKCKGKFCHRLALKKHVAKCRTGRYYQPTPTPQNGAYNPALFIDRTPPSTPASLASPVVDVEPTSVESGVAPPQSNPDAEEVDFLNFSTETLSAQFDDLDENDILDKFCTFADEKSTVNDGSAPIGFENVQPQQMQNLENTFNVLNTSGPPTAGSVDPNSTKSIDGDVDEVGALLESNDELNFQCDSCPRLFKTSKGLHGHFLKLHVFDGANTNNCGQVALSDADVLLSSATNNVEVCCGICGRNFDSDFFLQVHVSNEHKVDANSSNHRFTCEFCPTRFYRNDHLQKHIQRLHSVEKCENGAFNVTNGHNFDLLEVDAGRSSTQQIVVPNLNGNGSLVSDSNGAYKISMVFPMKHGNGEGEGGTAAPGVDGNTADAKRQQRNSAKTDKTSLKQLRCSYCPKTFQFKRYVRKHERLQHELPSERKGEGSSLVYNLKNSETYKLRCPRCVKRFATARLLKQHLAFHARAAQVDLQATS